MLVSSFLTLLALSNLSPALAADVATTNNVKLLSFTLSSSSSDSYVYQLTFDNSPGVDASTLAASTKLTLQSLAGTNSLSFTMQSSSSTVFSITASISPADYDYDRTLTLTFASYTYTVTDQTTSTTTTVTGQITPTSTTTTIDGLFATDTVPKKVLDLLVWIARGIVYAIYFITLMVHLISGGKSSLCLRFSLMLSRILFMQYFNLRFPLNVWNMLGMQVLPDRDLFIPSSWMEAIGLPPSMSITFQTYNKQNSLIRTNNFIDNVGAYTFIFLALLVIWIVILLPIHCLCHKKPKCGSAMTKITDTIRWNLILTLLFVGLNGFLISSLANLQNISVDSGTYDLLGFIFSVLMLTLLAVGVPFFPAQQIKKGCIAREIVPTSQVLSSDFDDSRLGKLFLSFYVLMNIALSCTAAFLSSYPLVQIIIQMAASAILICLLAIAKIFKQNMRDKFFKRKLQNFIAIFFEVTVIVLSILLIILYQDGDTGELLSGSAMVSFGWAVIGCLLFFLLVELAFSLYTLIKLFKKEKVTEGDPSKEPAKIEAKEPVKGKKKETKKTNKKETKIDIKNEAVKIVDAKENEPEKEKAFEVVKEKVKETEGAIVSEKRASVSSEKTAIHNGDVINATQTGELRKSIPLVDNQGTVRIQVDNKQGAEALQLAEDSKPKTSLNHIHLREKDTSHNMSLNDSKLELLYPTQDNLEFLGAKGRPQYLKRRRELDDLYDEM